VVKRSPVSATAVLSTCFIIEPSPRLSYQLLKRFVDKLSRFDTVRESEGEEDGHIGVNAAGDAGDASPAIFGQPMTKCLISPAKFVKIVIKLRAELMRTVQPAYKEDTDRDSPRERE